MANGESLLRFQEAVAPIGENLDAGHVFNDMGMTNAFPELNNTLLFFIGRARIVHLGNRFHLLEKNITVPIDFYCSLLPFCYQLLTLPLDLNNKIQSLTNGPTAE